MEGGEGICLPACAAVLDAEPLRSLQGPPGQLLVVPPPAEPLLGAHHWRASGHLQDPCLIPTLGWSVIGRLQAALHTVDALSSYFPSSAANSQTLQAPPVAPVVLTAGKPPGGQFFIHF